MIQKKFSALLTKYCSFKGKFSLIAAAIFVVSILQHLFYVAFTISARNWSTGHGMLELQEIYKNEYLWQNPMQSNFSLKTKNYNLPNTLPQIAPSEIGRNVRLPSPPDTLLVQQYDRIYHRKGWDSSPIIIEKYKLVFFTTAKVGCTVWKKLFRRMMGYRNWNITDGQKLLPWNPEFNGLKYLYHYNRAKASEIMSSPDWTRAIFLRDPKERMLSAYLDKVVQNPTFANRACCPFKLNCIQNTTSFSKFLDFIQTCENAHWAPQSRRMDAKYWKYINFWGNLETAHQDAERLLRRIGAWEKYGQSGWGRNGTESIFQPHHKVTHATDAKNRLGTYYTPDLERRVEEYCYYDYVDLNMTLYSVFGDERNSTR